MSSILKALQKLEKDKASRQTREPDISNAIISENKKRTTSTHWILPIVVTIVAATSVILTYTLMGGFSADRKAAKQLILESPPSLPPIAAQRPSSHLPPPLSAPVVAPTLKRSAIRNITEQTSKQAGTLSSISPPTGIPAAELSPLESVAPHSQPSTAPKDRLKEKPLSDPSFKINGIAWQKDSASRLAVINGVPVGEGGMVDGAKIEQIFQDRVIFSLGGRPFEVTLEREGHN